MWQAFIERRVVIERCNQSHLHHYRSRSSEIVKIYECDEINTAQNMAVYEVVNRALHVQTQNVASRTYTLSCATQYTHIVNEKF